ncbi:MAG: histidine kinase [Breznakibacter sp.]
MHMNIDFAKRKRLIELSIQLIAWAITISAPFFFNPPEDAPKGKAPVFVLIPWCFLTIFYFANCYFLISKLLFKKKIVLYSIIVLVCTFTFIFSPELLIGLNLVTLNAAPPSYIHDIGRLSSTVFFMLAYIISSGIAIIKELFYTWDEKQRAEKEKIEAELATLRLQVNPHFLFNTLYNIYYLTINKPDKAPNAILKLSDMMRFLLAEPQEKFIPLPKEVEFIHRYIDLQKLRISEKTKIEFATKGDYDTVKIAPLILFPFIENAFKYGISSHEKTYIDITLFVSEKTIQMDVANQKFQTIDDVGKNNTGLNNVINRLNLIYPNSHKLEIQNEHKYFNVSLVIFTEKE